MKPIVFKQSNTHWYTLYRDSEGKLHVTASAAWKWAICEALIAVQVRPRLTWEDCE